MRSLRISLLLILTLLITGCAIEPVVTGSKADTPKRLLTESCGYAMIDHY